uniref:Uncharacterized protein n=1 Tax=Anguilla anguilla TaxID=7936 RepID=A0A0E9VUT5_ANGAN
MLFIVVLSASCQSYWFPSL